MLDVNLFTRNSIFCVAIITYREIAPSYYLQLQYGHKYVAS